MAFMNDYLKEKEKLTRGSSNGNNKASSKTKRKKTKNLRSFMDEYREERSALEANNDDIAPVGSSISSRMTVDPIRSRVGVIAPGVKQAEEERTWFDSGAFDDGYQFGDISKAILGTGADLLENAGAGILGMGEKVVDAGAYVKPYLDNANFYLSGAWLVPSWREKQKERFAEDKERAAEFIAKDLYDEEAVAKFLVSNPIKWATGADASDDSLLGEKSDSLAQSAGQLVGQVGLQYVGVPWYVTSGATSFGSEAENSLRQGATYGEAGLSAAVTAGAEILSEKLFGGDVFTGKTGSSLMSRYLTTTISDKTLRTLAKLGIDTVGEGAEEVVSQVFSNLGTSLYREESLGEILGSEKAFDEYLESFLGGMVLGGGMSAINVAQSKKAGRDYVSELTEHEETVVKKVYEELLAEQDEELSAREKDKLYDSVLDSMQKGEISTDTIERILGGESYSNYDALRKEADEFNTLYNTEGGKLSEAQRDRLAELKEINKNNPYEDAVLNAREKLSQDVMGMVNGSKLVESYNERGRRGQAFEADLTKYDAKHQATIKKAIDSGILNNTRRTHEFVDIIAKISADKGVPFDFVNNAKLKESGFAIEGKTVNGFVTKDGISINIDSPKAWQSTVGHEIAHVLEGTELYSELQKAIFAYAESKGEYAARRKALEALYTGVKDANIDAELTADLVGDYLFTDSDFVSRLSTENRTTFEKIYDEIKYLYKVATAGSKEARQLERVKKAFDKAYRESGNGSAEVKSEDFYESATKYSLRVTDKETLDFLNNQETITTYKTMQLVDGKLYPPMAARVEGKFEDYSELGAWEQATERPDLIKNGKFKLDKGKGQGSIEAAYNPYMHSSNLVLNDQFSGAYKRDNLVTVECEVPVSELTSGYHAEYAKDPVGWHPWHTGTVAGQLRKAKGVERQVVLSRWIKPVRIVPDSEVAAKYKELLDGTDVEVPDNVVTPSLLKELQNSGVKVKESGRVQYSISDSTGKQLTKEQSEFFRDSKVRDENGNLKAVYHGSPADFNTFSLEYLGTNGTAEGYGFYFTDKKSIAENYSKGHEGQQNQNGGKLFECYLDIKKPLSDTEVTMTRAQFKKFLTTLNKQTDSDGEPLDILSNYGDVAWEGLNNVLNYAMEIEYDGSDSDVNLVHSIINGCGNMKVVFDVLRKTTGYDGIIVNEATWGGDQTIYIAFHPEQIKNVDNLNPTTNPDIRKSLSAEGEQFGKTGQFATPATELRLETAPEVKETLTPDVAPVAEDSSVVAADVKEKFPDDGNNPQMELDRLNADIEALETRIYALSEAGDFGDEFNRLSEEWAEARAKALEMEAEILESDRGRINSLEDSDIPPEMEAPYAGESDPVTVDNPFENRDWYEVGNRGVKAYMYENPEVKPFFQEEAMALLGELNDTTKGERFFNDQVYYDSGGEKGWMGVKRHTSKSMETLLDEWGMSYADVEKGLKAIIEDNGAENIAAAKKIEFMLNDRLLRGYKDFYSNSVIPPNQDYINLLNEKQINAYSKEAFDSFMQAADKYAPDDAAPVKPLAKATPDTIDAPIFESKDKNAVKGQTTLFEPPKPNPRVANVLTEESAIAEEKTGIGTKLVSALVDKGMVFENLSLKTGNHELQAKWNYTLPSNTEARAQYFMENGANGVKSLKDIKKTVDKSGKADDFFRYLYHVHNIDRMTLEDRFGVENKTVFGETVTADVSRREVAQYERANPEFKSWANDVYAYNRYLRQLLVNGNVISQETANLWENMYPHYVPIRRVDSKGQNISVPLDTNKTGVNNPIKKATGGSSDIQPVFSTMAQRTEQTYRAIARNAFGIELKNTLGTTINSQKNTTGVDEAVDTLVAPEDHLLKPGTMTSNPTFTVFENGEKVEFEITEDMFDALKPAGKILGYRNKAIGKVGEWRRNLLTQWNPVFALYRNPIKDLQDVAVNSQHALKTYLNIPNAALQLATNGKWATEYGKNGGKSNTYFDSRTNKFLEEDNVFKKTIGMPIRAIETAGEFIETLPRLAEYIASRKDGRSVERSMLDASRVTTNFAAGGDFTKFLNSHGFTFLNASVQGASQHVRNFREAKQQGLKGYVKVLAKYTIAGLPGILLNNLLWDDDEEYEELSDYVKENYYVIAKTEDGKFIRIPKGRTAAVMQNLMEQMQHLATGDDEADFGTFFELFMNNIAPNNPIENNILAPAIQAWKNKVWYGGDLVPSRLQSLPTDEQFDESTDAISKWLGENFDPLNLGPYKINYLIDQYSGGLGDMILPTLTPEAESGDDSFMGNLLAPWKKEMTTDSVLNNKNPGDFYDLRDELEVMSNSKDATEEDKMRSLYMDTVSWEMGDLYAKKREIQSSDLPDDEKYEAVRLIQEEINELANDAMDGYKDVDISGAYATVGDRRYNLDTESGKWYEIKPKNADGSANWYYQKEQEVTKGLGITPEQYWNNREEYNFAYDKPEQYAVAQAVGGYSAYRGYSSALWDIHADKDENGKSINGTRKEKVIEHINGLNADYGARIILFKSEYPADDTYNYEIVDYLNSRDDISYKEMETILKYLDFEVDSEGNVTW